MASKTVSTDRPTGAKPDGLKPYSVRGIEMETRQAITMAAKKANEPVGQWVNRALLAAAQDELKQSRQVGPTQDQMLVGLVEGVRQQTETTQRLTEQVQQLLQSQQQKRDGIGMRLARKLHLVP